MRNSLGVAMVSLDRYGRELFIKALECRFEKL